MDNPQAFPCKKTFQGQDEEQQHLGMTIRDYFANGYVAGVLSSNYIKDTPTPELIAQKAYILADAMLKERSK